MAVETKTLEEYLVQVRRIAEHREAGSEAKIRKMFAALKKELNAFIGSEYVKYAEDDKLDFAILQKNREYARFLEEVIAKFDDITPEVQKEVQSLIEETYKTCYAGMVDGVQKCGKVSEIRETFNKIKAITPSQVKAAVKNPIDKLTLKPTLERNRKNIISNVRREIAIGLNNGDRMSTMARRIQKYVDQDYRKSVLIARTEAHRVREAGFNDSATNLEEKLVEHDSEYRLVKTWRTMQDGAVRHTKLANHRDMEDVSVLQDEDFELTGGAKAPCPGMSGIAAEDCNCRCYVERELMTDEEYFAKTGKHFKEKPFTNKEKDDIIEKEENVSVPQVSVETAAYREEKFKTVIGRQKGLNKDFRAKMCETFANGSETAQKAFLKYANSGSVGNAAYTGGAHFNPGMKKVYFNAASLMSDPRGPATTYFHEFGHLVDYKSRSGRDKYTSTKGKAFGKALRTDFDDLVKSYTLKQNVSVNQAYAAIRQEFLREPHLTNQVSDIIGGLTQNKCFGRYGHEGNYWTTPGALELEAFAHMFESQFDSARYAIMKKYFPTALQTFESMLGGIV